MPHATRPRTFDPAGAARFETWLAGEIGARKASVLNAELLPGGAIGENWRLDVSVEGGPRAGRHAWVLRTDAASRMAMSHDRAHEFACMQAAHQAGVGVPEPVAVQRDSALIGAPFMVVGLLKGNAQARKLVRDPELPGFGEALAERLGGELAKLHTVRPPRADLAFLSVPKLAPAREQVRQMRESLDKCSEPRPALEYILCWLERNAPPANGLVLVHGDFRTGNYMVDKGRLTGILDWEFAHWGDRHEDLAWICARCWRFGSDALEAGGIAPREALYRGYEAAGGARIDRAAMPFWEVLAAARWAVVALLQGERHHTGGERSLELILTGMMSPEMEWDALEGLERIDAAAR
jgi:aminoglycoside phosphotransferase (APT) family kinase protein